MDAPVRGSAAAVSKRRIAPLGEIPDVSQDEYMRRLERSLPSAQPSPAVAMRAWHENNPPMYDTEAYERELKTRLLDRDVLAEDAFDDDGYGDDADDDFGIAGAPIVADATPIVAEVYTELEEASDDDARYDDDDDDGTGAPDEYSVARSDSPPAPRLVVAPALSRIQAALRLGCCTLTSSQLWAVVAGGGAFGFVCVMAYVLAGVYPWGA